MMKKVILMMLFLGLLAGAKAEKSSAVHPFYWKGVSMGDTLNEHGAILVPLYLKKDTVLVQLDLGMADHVIYEPALERLESGFEKTMFGNVELSGRIGNEDFEATFKPKGAMADSMIPVKNGKPVIGLLGLNFFKDKALTLDFIRDRFAINGFPDKDAYHQWALPAKLIRNKLFVNLASKDSADPFWVFYDTGSSPFNLITGGEQFGQLTNPRTPGDTLAIQPRHTGRGRQITFECKPIQKALDLGPFTLEGRNACTDVGGRINFKGSRLGIKGVLGNKPFIGNALVHMNFQEPTFQILLP